MCIIGGKHCVYILHIYCNIVLGKFLIEVYNESYQHGSLPESQRVAVMSLIFKGGDEENTENYRPVSLTNVDYRILAFTLAQRMQKIIGNVISNDQSAYIQGRTFALVRSSETSKFW